jgi:hypothetical protein
MQGLEVLRLDPFDRHNAHGGPGHGFTYALTNCGAINRTS